ncbi:ABC transporter permease, partial [Nocardioides sp. GCM10030258]|uniref:ABC transporter permease n=1 Tax=unclassified Nocardioides TaxID=2615069 RepID=UPI00360E1FFA
ADRRRSPAINKFSIGKYSGVLIFALIVLVFGIWTPDTFLTATNFRSILASQAIIAILALGLLFPLAAGAFDLSAAQNLGFCAVLCGALLTKNELPVPVAIAIALGAGIVVGMFNGFLVAVIGINSFIATLGTTSLLTAGSQVLTDGTYLGPFPDSFQDLTSGAIFTLPVIVIYLFVFAVIAWFVLEHTPLGRRIYAAGANADAARLTGVNTTRMVFGSLVISGFAAAVAGVLLASTLGSVSSSLGPEYLLPAFAGAFLGTTQLKPGRFNVGGTMLAIFLLGTGVQGLQLVGGEVWVTALFNGVALIVAVGAVLFVRRLQDRRATRRPAQGSRSKS